MLIIDLNKNFNSKIVQDRWKSGLIPHFVGIVIGDGSMVAMRQKYVDADPASGCYILPDYESTIEKFIENSDHFIDVTVMVNRVFIHEIDCEVICGEGEMGNEGFVAMVRGDILIWSAFFTISNPFYEIRRIGDSIIAKSTHEIFWNFPIFEPWNVVVLKKRT